MTNFDTDNTLTISHVLYLHIPFCQERCSYCVFNTYTGLAHLIPEYVQTLQHELAWLGGRAGRPNIHTIYFGGGTPSVLSPGAVASLLAAIDRHFAVSNRVEITLEANPATASWAYLRALRSAGVNRLSLGAQSANERDLRLFNRDHDWNQVKAAVVFARRVGFANVSLDLIYGAPYQTLPEWQNTLEEALRLQPEHVSLYSLGIEPGSAMHVWVMRGALPEPDSDAAADMYDLACEMLASGGYQQYEISNWAKPGFACEHNLQYWRNLPYFGAGAGAHAYLHNMRYAVVRSPWEYIRRVKNAAVWDKPYPLSPAADMETVEYVDTVQERAETLMMGLRLIEEGVALKVFRQRFGKPLEAFYPRELEILTGQGLLTRSEQRIRLTERARLLGNYVFSYFV